MAREVLIRPAALSDIDGHIDYLFENDAGLPARFLDDLFDAFDRLADFPQLGAIRAWRTEEYATIRLWPLAVFKNHVVLYRPRPESIEVIRVLHAASDFSRFTRNE